MSAVYALARRIDDIGDGDADPAEKLSNAWPRRSAPSSSTWATWATIRCCWPCVTPLARIDCRSAVSTRSSSGCENDVVGAGTPSHRQPWATADWSPAR